MTERFMAILAMEQPRVVKPERLIEVLRQNLPGLPVAPSAIEPRRQPGEPASESYLLDVGGTVITVMFLDRPTPQGTYDFAIRHSLHWPDAAAQLQRERAHAIVATLSEPADVAEAVRSATFVTLVSAAIAALTGSIGVYWATGETVTERDGFIQAATRLTNGQFPVETWMQLALFAGTPSPTGQKTVAAVTTGFSAFGFREIEFQPAAVPPATLASRLIGTVQYLLTEGPVLKSGDTLGISESERIRVQFQASDHRSGTSVYALSLEQIDETLATGQAS